MASCLLQLCIMTINPTQQSAHGLKKDHQYFRYFRKFSVIFLLSTSFFFLALFSFVAFIC